MSQVHTTPVQVVQRVNWSTESDDSNFLEAALNQTAFKLARILRSQIARSKVSDTQNELLSACYFRGNLKQPQTASRDGHCVSMPKTAASALRIRNTFRCGAWLRKSQSQTSCEPLCLCLCYRCVCVSPCETLTVFAFAVLLQVHLASACTRSALPRLSVFATFFVAGRRSLDSCTQKLHFTSLLNLTETLEICLIFLKYIFKKVMC